MQPAESILDRFGKLIDRLAEKTANDAVSWVAGEQDNCYQANFAAFSVELELKHEYYWIHLYDETGRVIESISSSRLDAEHQGRLRDLYGVARRKALNVDKAFDDILAALA